MTTTILPEFKFLNHVFAPQEWQLKFNEDLGYVVSCKMTQESREKIKQVASLLLPKIAIYEDKELETIAFNRKEIKALLKEKEPLNPIEKNILKRKSGYQFDPTRTPTDEMLERIFNAARQAPSAYNEQPWRFIVCNKTKDLSAYQKLYDLLPERAKPWIGDAPVLVVIISAVKKLQDTPTGIIQVSSNRWALYDTGAASLSMMLVATSFGLMTHQAGGFNAETVSKCFEVEKGFESVAVMAIGYSAEKDVPSKIRKPLNEIVFNSAWGNPL